MDAAQAPPSNSSPDEIQAWNHMMETMVTFIKASTHLMDTINRKMRAEGKCEPQCKAGAALLSAATPAAPEEAPPDGAASPESASEEICAAIRSMEAPAAGGDSEVAEQQPCACPTEDLLRDMAGKLERAQREIDLLQREMVRLQQGRRSGPDTAILYRQIMKGSEVRRSSPVDDDVGVEDCVCEPGSPGTPQVSTIWPPSTFATRRGVEYSTTPPRSIGGYQSASPHGQFYQDPSSAFDRRFVGSPPRSPRMPRDFRTYGDSPSPIRRAPNNASCMMRLAVYQDFMRGRDQSGVYPSPDGFRSLASSTAPSGVLGDEPSKARSGAEVQKEGVTAAECSNCRKSRDALRST
ncbi:uncharacterized protein LOC132707243 isoform X2 [Cylas formicarius]|uniref:uncharacterized protein LOC132707243 isoform X2 n=1 Tax=Cylas formicarius TaxID=197179 RepID=UPI0029584327|nr:uncharacterized protein LOC132707243 isoform X2 [Cylas formicarius]